LTKSPRESLTTCVLADRLTYFYPEMEKPALLDVSLKIARGELIAVMGPNGCGKSTLARLLTGLLTPSSGKLQVLGSDLGTSAGRRAVSGRVGIVFQSPDEQMVTATVEREVAFGLENLGVPPTEIRTRVDEALIQVNLARYSKRSPHLLSGGEKQRLALASVLVMQPQLLILDEVTSLLDPSGRREVRDMIQSLRGERTVVLITQFPEETLIADRLIILHEGRLVHDAPPKEIFADPQGLHSLGIDAPLIFRLLKATDCAQNPDRK